MPLQITNSNAYVLRALAVLLAGCLRVRSLLRLLLILVAVVPVLKHAENIRMALAVSGLPSVVQPSASSDPKPATSMRCP